MKKLTFLFGLFCGSLLALLLWLSFWAGQLGNPSPNSAWIDAAYEKKIDVAKNTPSPKIVIVGGSSSMFGVNSRMLEKVYGIPAVNLGVNAGISLQSILELAKQVIKQGDLVILPIEYPLYDRNDPISQPLVDWMNEHPDMLMLLPLDRMLGVILKTSLDRILIGYQGIPDNFEVTGTYGPQNLDSHGDQINSSIEQRTIGQEKFRDGIAVKKYGHQIKNGYFYWDELKSFTEAIERQGGCAVFMPPPMMFKRYYKDNDIEHAFYTDLNKKMREHGLFWLGKPFETMYDNSHFFDTNFHLTSESRKIHTEKLISWLGDEPRQTCKAYYENND